jgi:hypothetical protein
LRSPVSVVADEPYGDNAITRLGVFLAVSRAHEQACRIGAIPMQRHRVAWGLPLQGQPPSRLELSIVSRGACVTISGRLHRRHRHRELSDGGVSKALVGGQPHARLLMADAHLDDGVGKRSPGLLRERRDALSPAGRQLTRGRDRVPADLKSGSLESRSDARAGTCFFEDAEAGPRAEGSLTVVQPGILRGDIGACSSRIGAVASCLAFYAAADHRCWMY